AEGVTELEAVVAGERNALDNFDPKGGDLAFPRFQVADFVSDVGLGGIPIPPVLHADVDLAIPDLEPQAATPRQARRLLDFREAEDTAIEATGLLFGAIGDGKLDVVNAPDHFIAPVLRVLHVDACCDPRRADDPPVVHEAAVGVNRRLR